MQLTSFPSQYHAARLTFRGPSSDHPAMSRSLANARADLDPHQVDAALFAVRSPLAKGVILADEVGLGKTIEAGLVVAQRWAERRRHILLILPATLRTQWARELEEKFCVPNVILDARSYARDGEVVVFVGETLNGELNWYGVSGGIPGPLEVTPRSATLISWLTHAGIDATFDDDEIGLMGETLAHEVGHYLGLQHPVQSAYDRWDALDDTVECNTRAPCESALGDNLMFPYSICDADGCVDTFRLTDGQVGELQRAGATR